MCAGSVRSLCLGLQGRLLRDRWWERWSDGSRCGRRIYARLPGGRRCRNRRRNGFGLAGLVRNGHRVGDVIDDDRIVHVVVDHVIGRWRRHVARRRHPNWDWPIDRHRQNKQSNRRRRWRQDHELRRWRRQEDDGSRRRWCEAKYRIAENQNRSPHEDDLFGRRRRQVIRQCGKARWRLEGCPKKCKPAPRIPAMGPFGVAAQIRPVCCRRIDEPASSPRDGLAPGRD